MNSASPKESVHELAPGDEVFANRKNGWEGPYTFLYPDHRLLVVLDGKGREHLLHSTILRPYHRPLMVIKNLLNSTDDGDFKASYVFLFETVHDKNNLRFAESRQKEFYGNMNKNGVKPIPISELSPDATIIGNCYVLCIKDPGTKSERFKARWILLGHKDKFRHKLANDSPILMYDERCAVGDFTSRFFSAV